MRFMISLVFATLSSLSFAGQETGGGGGAMMLYNYSLTTPSEVLKIERNLVEDQFVYSKTLGQPVKTLTITPFRTTKDKVLEAAVVETLSGEIRTIIIDSEKLVSE